MMDNVAENIVSFLRDCDDKYYNSGSSTVSDDTYDALLETLRRVSPNHPYLEKVGARVRETSDKVGRVLPMGTLAKCHKDEEIQKWLGENKGEILICPKYDGFGVELLYEKGRLVLASTRGDGYVGEDVTEAMMRIHDVPLCLPKKYEGLVRVRGEVIVPRRYHDELKKLGYTAMRNAVPGIVRSKRSDALMFVDFVAYEFFDGSTDRYVHRVRYQDVFDVEMCYLFDVGEFSQIKELREGFSSERENYIYETDGMVLKTRIIMEDDLLCPKYQIAWKFKSNRETTVLRGVEYQMGATGYFTPIGIFDEVEFQGAKLTRASLGNICRVKSEFDGMTIGSLVEVSRRGDIIPYIEKLIMVDTSQSSITVPTSCPYCSHELAIDDKGEPYCNNPHCPELLNLQISNYVKSLGVKGIGDKLVRALIDKGYIKDLCDIYLMNPEVILSLPRQGTSSMDKWHMLQLKPLTYLEFLTAYPFVDLGKRIWEVVLGKFTYEEILTLTHSQLSEANLKGLGESKINSIIRQVECHRDELYKLGRLITVL